MKSSFAIATLGLALSSCSSEQTETPVPTGELESQQTSQTIPTSSDRNAYFGDVHIHTRNSMDAYIFNVRATPDDSYRYAKGETINHPAGYAMTIHGGPLDFYAVTDHAEYLGILPAMDIPGTRLNQHPIATAMHSDDMFVRLAAFLGMIAGSKNPELHDDEIINTVWMETVAAATRHNEPGVFTTFAAFEYSASQGEGAVLHRNVLFREDAPDTAFSSLESGNPEDLWDWMDAKREAGFESLAIPHNPNLSEGWAFKLETFDGDSLSAGYAAQRMRNEPLVEVTQIKGSSETHPGLSPNDEWANFEILESMTGSPLDELKGRYVRDTYRSGLKLEETEGYNPFKFGLIGSSDTHLAGAAYSDEDFVGKFGMMETTAEKRGSVPRNREIGWEDSAALTQTAGTARFSASGLTGVWAESNTRDSIFDAFRRKETFATSGPRIKVRFFAGYDFSDDLIDDPALVQKAYASGVSMGGDLIGDGRAPNFLVWAQRDVNSAPLQRVQVIKVTGDSEAVFDVACHVGQPDSATHRCPDNDASVDLSTCALVGTGATELRTLWSDPQFDAKQGASYYVRVLENPSCRWSTWDAIRNGTPPRPDIPSQIQERAYTSPIWYLPT